MTAGSMPMSFGVSSAFAESKEIANSFPMLVRLYTVSTTSAILHPTSCVSGFSVMHAVAVLTTHACFKAFILFCDCVQARPQRLKHAQTSAATCLRLFMRPWEYQWHAARRRTSNGGTLLGASLFGDVWGHEGSSSHECG